jgi:hypothetical protein
MPLYDLPPCIDTSLFKPSVSFISLENKVQAMFPVYLAVFLLVSMTESLLSQELVFSQRKSGDVNIGNYIVQEPITQNFLK